MRDGIHRLTCGFLEGLAEGLRLHRRSICLVDPNLEPADQPRLDHDLGTHTYNDRRYGFYHLRSISSRFESSDLSRFSRTYVTSVSILQKSMEGKTSYGLG